MLITEELKKEFAYPEQELSASELIELCEDRIRAARPTELADYARAKRELDINALRRAAEQGDAVALFQLYCFLRHCYCADPGRGMSMTKLTEQFEERLKTSPEVQIFEYNELRQQAAQGDRNAMFRLYWEMAYVLLFTDDQAFRFRYRFALNPLFIEIEMGIIYDRETPDHKMSAELRPFLELLLRSAMAGCILAAAEYLDASHDPVNNVCCAMKLGEISKDDLDRQCAEQSRRAGFTPPHSRTLMWHRLGWRGLHFKLISAYRCSYSRWYYTGKKQMCSPMLWEGPRAAEIYVSTLKKLAIQNAKRYMAGEAYDLELLYFYLKWIEKDWLPEYSHSYLKEEHPDNTNGDYLREEDLGEEDEESQLPGEKGFWLDVIKEDGILPFLMQLFAERRWRSSDPPMTEILEWKDQYVRYVYRSLAKKGEPLALYRTAADLLKRSNSAKDVEAALGFLQRIPADSEYYEASLWRQARIFRDGQGDRPKDPAAALNIYQSILEQPLSQEIHVLALANLGLAYLYGAGVKKDDQTARAYLEQARQEDDKQYEEDGYRDIPWYVIPGRQEKRPEYFWEMELAHMYLLGIGGPRQLELAFFYFSAFKIGGCWALGPAPCRLTISPSEYYYGNCLYYGIGTEQDKEKGARLIWEARNAAQKASAAVTDDNALRFLEQRSGGRRELKDIRENVDKLVEISRTSRLSDTAYAAVGAGAREWVKKTGLAICKMVGMEPAKTEFGQTDSSQTWKALYEAKKIRGSLYQAAEDVRIVGNYLTHDDVIQNRKRLQELGIENRRSAAQKFPGLFEKCLTQYENDYGYLDSEEGKVLRRIDSEIQEVRRELQWAERQVASGKTQKGFFSRLWEILT